VVAGRKKIFSKKIYGPSRFSKKFQILDCAKKMNNAKKPTQKELPYIEILKQAGRIVWQNKFLLWFGLLMALGSPGNFNVGNNEDWEKKGGAAAQSFIESHWQIVLAIALVLFAVGIVLFLISLAAKAGLVKSVNLIAQNKKTTFRAGWKTGKKYVGKLFRLYLLFFFTVLVIIAVLALPAIFLAMKGSWVSAIVLGILAFAVFIPLVYVIALTNIFAEFYIILSDLGVWSAVENGYDLLLKNVKNSIVFGLLLVAVNIAAGIVLLPVAGIALLILIPTGAIFFYMSKIIFGIFLFFAIVFFLLAVLSVSSIFITFKTTAWTLFFREIAKVEKPETEKAAESVGEPEESVAATPATPATSSKLQQSESFDEPEKA